MEVYDYTNTCKQIFIEALFIKLQATLMVSNW